MLKSLSSGIFLIIVLLLSACQVYNNGRDPTGVTGTTEATEMEQQVHSLINQYRNDRGLSDLQLNQTIIDTCREHSRNMGEGIVPFSHDGFDQRADSLMNGLSLSAVAENVAWNYGHSDPAETAVAGWIASDGHRENIEGNYDLTGIGIYQNSDQQFYFTQIFGRTR